MKRHASAHWQGGIKDGNGRISTQTGVLKDTPYSFSSRFESGRGTNPEELVAAAHAGCFSMALALELGKARLTPESIDTRAEVSIEQQGEGFAVTAAHLEVEARIPGADKSAFERAANAAKTGCPISRLLNTEITMNARLLG